MHRSSGVYEALRDSGCIKLPSQRTLRDYTHYIKACTGFSSEVDQMLIKAAKVESCPEREKCVILLLDEMHIREDLVFDKHTGAMIGYANLGDLNDHLLHFEQSLSDSAPASPKLAKTMMVFMVRGLFSKLQFAYAQFPCADLSGDLLYEPFWEAVGRLETCGFKVGFITFLYFDNFILNFDHRCLVLRWTVILSIDVWSSFMSHLLILFTRSRILSQTKSVSYTSLILHTWSKLWGIAGSLSIVVCGYVHICNCMVLQLKFNFLLHSLMDGTYHGVICETYMRGTHTLEQESGCYQNSNMSISSLHLFQKCVLI